MSDNRNQIITAAKAFSVGDKLLFANKEVHAAFFSNVNWTKEEEYERREGLYLETKELSPVTQFIFKHILGKWNVIKNLQWLGIATKAQEKRIALYKESAMIGMIIAPDLSRTSLVNGGRLLQKFWLTATKLGISFQPLTVGLLYLGQRTQEESSLPEFTQKQVAEIKRSYEIISHNLLKDTKFPVFSFRLGYAGPPAWQSLKKEPTIVYKK